MGAHQREHLVAVRPAGLHHGAHQVVARQGDLHHRRLFGLAAEQLGRDAPGNDHVIRAQHLHVELVAGHHHFVQGVLLAHLFKIVLELAVLFKNFLRLGEKPLGGEQQRHADHGTAPPYI